MKRAFDLVLSCVGLFALCPLFCILALAIKLESHGPVFYRGERVGRNGKDFRIYKFRSMVTNAEKLGSSTTSGSDSRITRVGRIIRKCKLDEFSQLINVLKGEMSLVGPRPQVRWAVDLFNDEEREVLKLRPGITDWASIRFRDEGAIIERSGIADPDEAYFKLIHPEKMRLQLKYLRERSFRIDLKIILLTLGAIVSPRLAGGETTVSSTAVSGGKRKEI